MLFNAGMTDYLSKPLHPEQLLDKIEMHLEAALETHDGAEADEQISRQISEASPSRSVGEVSCWTKWRL